MSKKFSAFLLGLGCLSATLVEGSEPAESKNIGPTLPGIQQRFAPNADGLCDVKEVPDFQKHVSPLLGRLGCNGRACHGSFQGRGGFMLSLFGYDFHADHKALLENSRVNKDEVLESLILSKPVDPENHEGGKRFEKEGWEYWVLRKWIEGGAKNVLSGESQLRLERLDVQPLELRFGAAGENAQLQVMAKWSDGSMEDVTSLSRFFSNDHAIAAISEQGVVTGGEYGDTHVVVSYDNAVVPIPVLRPRGPSGSFTSSITQGLTQAKDASEQVDRLVERKLEKLGILPAERCSDSDFIRRVSLDMTGTLPTANRVRLFLEDRDPNKRSQLIEELLASPGYAGWWSTFLCDITGNNEEQLRNFTPLQRLESQHWYQWIYKRLAENVPYDQIVEGIVTAVSREPGESYREYCEAMSKIAQDPTGKAYADRSNMMYYWTRRNQKTSEERAIAFAYSFLGVRIQCAQCHKHPFDQWSKTDFEQFERLFDGVVANQNSLLPDSKDDFNEMLKELGVSKSLKGNDLRKQLTEKVQKGKTIPFPELYVAKQKSNGKEKDKKSKGKSVEGPTARLLGGEVIDLQSTPDPRIKLMEWLRRKDNPYFAKAIVNRIWTHYFDVGIVDPSDDMNLANAPSNRPLLDYLAEQFVEHQYDLHWLHRTIANSSTYQRSWKTNETNALDRRNFSHALLKRLPAEVAYDSIQIAIRNDKDAGGICNFSQDRALSIGGSSPRGNTGGSASYALSVFGRSTRETNCDCDRSNDPSLLQTVFVRNDLDVLKALRDPSHSWIGQLERDLDPAKVPDGSNDLEASKKGAARLAALRQQITGMEKKREKLVAKGNSEEIAKLEARIATLKKVMESDAPAIETKVLPKSKRDLSDQDIRKSIDEAYLRTLSRYPTEREQGIAMKSIQDSSNPIEGLGDVLWALINTKEFILNH